jgi:septin 3/9/12
LINNEKAWEPVVKYIKDQYSLYLRRELTPARERSITDTRVHAVIYFVFPSGHGLSSLDILAMKAISECANLIPVIAKSDTLTLEERFAFKARVKDELKAHGIQVYPNIYGLHLEELSATEKKANEQVAVFLTFLKIVFNAFCSCRI